MKSNVICTFLVAVFTLATAIPGMRVSALPIRKSSQG